MSLVARSTLWFARAGAVLPDPYYNGGIALPETVPNQPLSQADGIVHAVAQGSLRFVGASNVALHSTASSVTIGAFGETDVVTVGSNSVTVNGNVFVRGGLETLTAVELRLQDKVVRVGQPVASPGDGGVSQYPVVADADLDGAGLAIGPDSSPDRSLTWRAPHGGEESRWSLRGGGLHIERTFDNGAITISYGLRINDAGEFEIVRRSGDDAVERVFVAGPDAGGRPPALASVFGGG